MTTDLNEAFDAWQRQPTSAGMNQLLGAANPILDRAITTFAGRQSPILKARAKSLAIKAFRSYNPKAGTKIRTHLMTQLQPLRRSAIQSGQIIRTPERMVYDRRTMQDAHSTFMDARGREPAEDELADATGLSVRRIRALNKMRATVATGQLGEEYEVPTDEPAAEDMWLEYVYHDLGPRDKLILDWRLGRHGQPRLPNNEIAKRLGISAAAISQRMARIAERLQEGEGLHP